MSSRDQKEVMNFDKDTTVHPFLVYHIKKFTLSIWNGQYEKLDTMVLFFFLITCLMMQVLD